MTMGLTYARTKYRANLVGNRSGAPLDPALRNLPGDNLSNAPEHVATASAAWTPAIGASGLFVHIQRRKAEQSLSAQFSVTSPPIR